MADFWAGYISGAIGILVGNPLDLIKTRLQAGPAPKSLESPLSTPTGTQIPKRYPIAPNWTSWARGAAAPILGYGALNALLFMTYNRSLAFLDTGAFSLPSGHEGQTSTPPPPSPPLDIWLAGALGGLATFVVSAPTELVKCRAQVSEPPRSSWEVAKEMWMRGDGQGGVRGLYLGGGITSVRDAVGYGFYFWSYDASKRMMTREGDGPRDEAIKVLLCGGLAGVATWVSIFPLDVIKTRIQTFDLRRSGVGPGPGLVPNSGEHYRASETQALLRPSISHSFTRPPSAWHIAREIQQQEGMSALFRGLGVCSVRAFVVNAIQWAVYEWMMTKLLRS